MEFRLIDRLPLSDQGAVFQLYSGRERVLKYIKKKICRNEGEKDQQGKRPLTSKFRNGAI
jgi:hypothetical protein